MWLYVPNTSTSSPCAPEERALISASSWQFKALEQCAWSRGKVSRSRNWYQLWKRASWLQRLYGAMPEPSTAELGVALWTASLVASRASHTASPDASAAAMTSETYGRTLGASSCNPGPGLSSSRMSPECSRQGMMKSLAQSGFTETFASLASRWREDCSKREKLARRISESDFSSSVWPTATANMTTGPGSSGRDGGDNLQAAVANWLAPSANEDAAGTVNGKMQQMLTQQAKRMSSQWTTPSASDGERGGTLTEAMSGTSLAQQVNTIWPTPRVTTNGGNGNGARALDPANCRLEDTAAAFRSSPQGQTNQNDGSMCSEDRRSLNPLFVEWLMGWPPAWTLVAWTDFACSEMELSLFKQRMRSALLSLGLPHEAPPAQLALFG